MKRMTTIYLIRHAQAEGNLFRRMHGQFDSNLTPTGLRQLTQLHKRFSSISLDACYCSDLTRAKNTAQAVCNACGLEFRVDPGFREVGIGIWEDVPFGYLNTFHGLKMVQFGRDPVNWSVEGSETHQQYVTRFLESMESAALRHAGGSIAIVTHSVVMRNVLRVLFPDVTLPHSANTAVSCLEYENGSYSAHYFNDSSHLDPALFTSSRQKWWQQDGAQGDDTFWFREGMAQIETLRAPNTSIAYTVLEDHRPVGYVCLSEVDADTGRVDFLGLIEMYRGFDLSVQLLGHAVYVLRSMGKKWLLVRPDESPQIQALCKKFAFISAENGDLVLDLSLRIQSYPMYCG